MTTSILPRELDGALDGLIETYGQGEWREAAAAARAEHAERTGRVFEEDELYEARTVAFLEWYVTERPLPEGKTPVERTLAEAPDEALTALAASHRSLFAVAELLEGSVVLDDLWGGGRFAVDERRRLHGVAIGDVVEARLIGWRDRVRFGRTFTFHPAATRPAIVAHLKRIRTQGGSRADAVDHVASLQVKALRWKHVEIAKVYAAERDK